MKTYGKWVPKLIMILSFIDFIHMFMVSQMLQNSTTYYFHSTKILIQLQQKHLFNFTKIFIQLQQNYLFNFNKNIYSTSTKIISFNKYIYSTSTNKNFIQQQSSQTFKISSFNKIPRATPVKYKTILSHASNISKACQTHN